MQKIHYISNMFKNKQICLKINKYCLSNPTRVRFTNKQILFITFSNPKQCLKINAFCLIMK